MPTPVWKIESWLMTAALGAVVEAIGGRVGACMGEGAKVVLDEVDESCGPGMSATATSSKRCNMVVGAWGAGEVLKCQEWRGFERIGQTCTSQNRRRDG